MAIPQVLYWLLRDRAATWVYDTDLDPQLRRRGIKTIVLGGISTNIDVEATARRRGARLCADPRRGCNERTEPRDPSIRD